jgi:16S rRNA (guanine966-N2)-methyltransferase
MRIIGGKFRSRKLSIPSHPLTRPTSDRTREAIFNILNSLEGGINADTLVLDAFAGSGALGLEALSRGAAHATFIERDPQAMKVVKQNVSTLQVNASCTLILADATHPPFAPLPMGLIFLDPPYRQNLEGPCLNALQAKGWIGKHTIIILETWSKQPLPAPDGFYLVDQRRYGGALISFLQTHAPLTVK